MIILLYTLRSYANTFIPQLVWLPGVRCYGPPSCGLVRLAPKCASLWGSSLYGLPSEGWGSLCSHVCRRPSADGAMYQYWSAFRPILVTARSNIGRVTEQYCSALRPILLFLGRPIALSYGLQKKGVALSAACLSHPITRTPNTFRLRMGMACRFQTLCSGGDCSLHNVYRVRREE